MDFKDIVETRYATKKFTGEQLSESKIKELLHLIKMSASSFGLQPYKIVIVKDKAIKEKLLEASMKQPQIITCSHLLVFCANTEVMEQIDKYEQMMKQVKVPEEKIKGYIGIMRGYMGSVDADFKKSWAQKQAYIALGNAINGAKSLGFDSCPMEGFMPEEYSKILELPSNLIPTVICPIGIAADESMGKLRYSDEELFINK